MRYNHHGFLIEGDWDEDGSHGRLSILGCPEDGCPGDGDPDSKWCRDCSEKDDCIEHQTCVSCGEKNYYCDWEDTDDSGDTLCPDCKKEYDAENKEQE